MQKQHQYQQLHQKNLSSISNISNSSSITNNNNNKVKSYNPQMLVAHQQQHRLSITTSIPAPTIYTS
jgi:hypothetical protein